jgi:hypothetical protein
LCISTVEPGFDVRARQLDVDDHVLALEGRARELQPHRAAHEALAAVAGHQPVGGQAVLDAAASHAQRHPVFVLLEGDELAAPPDVDQVSVPGGRVDQELLDPVLLDVDHRRQTLERVVRHREAQDLVEPVERASALPRQALGQVRLERAELAQDLEAAARDADRAAADADRGVGLEHHRGHAAHRERQRQRQPHRTAAGDRDAVPRGVGAGRQRRRRGRVLDVLEGSDAVHGAIRGSATRWHCRRAPRRLA